MIDGGPTHLDARRGALDLRAAEARRTLRARGADAERRGRCEATVTAEELFLGEPSTSLCEAVEKARYLLLLFAATAEARSVNRQRGIARVLDELSGFLT
jgi:hypothetical protein